MEAETEIHQQTLYCLTEEEREERLYQLRGCNGGRHRDNWSENGGGGSGWGGVDGKGERTRREETNLYVK